MDVRREVAQAAAELRVLVLGSGFAAQGHTEAFRDTGCTVVGMAARSADVAAAVAAKMQIPWHGSNWAAALEQLGPDIVAVATPGGAHRDPILAAVAAGAHVYCDKPLAVDVTTANELATAAETKGVKTAFAASYCYQPQVQYARDLVAAGELGDLLEVECISHYALNPLIPFGWSHRVAEGGGRMNNNLTHKLSIVLRVSDGRVSAVGGEARNDLLRAPAGPHAHDFRLREEGAPTLQEAARRNEWHAVDSDWSYTVQARIDTPHGQRPVSALFHHLGLQPRRHSDYVSFYGSDAALHIDEAYAQGTCWLWRRDGGWRQAPVPAEIIAGLPDIADDTQRNWTQLAREFVAHITGTGPAGYLTFREGAQFQALIDTVRGGPDWTAAQGPGWPQG